MCVCTASEWAKELKPRNEKRLCRRKQCHKILFVLKAENDNEAHDEEFGHEHNCVDGSHIFKEGYYLSLQKPLNGENGSYRDNSYTANIRHCLTEIIVLYNSENRCCEKWEQDEKNY